MIAPTARAILLAALGAPLSLLIAALAPKLWPVGAAWIAAILVLVLIDALLAPPSGAPSVSVEAPPIWPVGAPMQAAVKIAFAQRAPRTIEAAIATNALLEQRSAPARAAMSGNYAEARFELMPLRRGEGRVERAFLRWTGPFGMASRQRTQDLQTRSAITPDIVGVQREAERLFSRTQMHGLKPLRDRGDGSEFDALVEYQPGMDRRLIDWKQSARHTKLLQKEVRAERNHQIVLAFDCGRLMCEPIAGTPRIDWAINAGLVLSYVGLKLGDRIGLFSFDARPRLNSGFAGGMKAFPHLKALSSAIDYSMEETNFTLALQALSVNLQRRSMIVVFTDFIDSISAELMLDNLARLMRRHLILFVTFRDDELEAMIARAPDQMTYVSRAVIAERILREREIVLARLRRMGAEIVEAPAANIGPALVRAYDAVRRRERV